MTSILLACVFWLIKVEEDLTEGLLLANIPDHKTFFKGNGLLNSCLFPLCYMHAHFHYAYWIGYTHQGFGHLNAYLWDTGECWKKLNTEVSAQGRIIWSMCVVTFWRSLLKHNLEQPCVADLPVIRGSGQECFQRSLLTSVLWLCDCEAERRCCQPLGLKIKHTCLTDFVDPR